MNIFSCHLKHATKLIESFKVILEKTPIKSENRLNSFSKQTRRCILFKIMWEALENDEHKNKKVLKSQHTTQLHHNL